MHNSSSPAFRAVAAAVLLLSLAACSDTFASLGASPAVAEANAEQLLESVRARFDRVEFTPSYEEARAKLASAALAPSSIFDDYAWAARPSPSTRLLYIAGNTVDDHYRLETRLTNSPPLHPGDSRHVVSLERLDKSVFHWDTKVEMGIGEVSAAEVSALIGTLFTAPQGRSEQELRADYRKAFPRATEAFGHGLAIDSLSVTPGAGGTTNVSVTVGFHPDLMRPTYPAFANYLDKYLAPAKYHVSASDAAGTPLLDVVGHDRETTIRYRLQNGAFTSLSGPPRAWPDTVQLVADVSLKVMLFTVGFHDLLTSVVIGDSGHERGWAVIAQHEPQWDLPFVAERLIRSPLRRPFQGEGTVFGLSVRDSATVQSVFTRYARTTVQESPIMRFLGKLSARAVNDIDANVEADEDRFWHDGFTALEADLRANAGRP